MQLFVDPCYRALCSLSDYAGGARPLPPELLPDGVESAGNERLWRLPLAIQLPSLVLLPLCLVAVACIVVWAVTEPRGCAASACARSGSLRS